MKETTIATSGGQEVNLTAFLKKVYRHRLVFLASIAGFLLLALLYIAVATPTYEASTSLLIDSSGSNRTLGESQYVEGGVSLIEMEKNLYNEIGIIQSFSLVNQTVADLNLDITYQTDGLFNEKEHYGYFPFEVELERGHAQLYNLPFEIELISGDGFSLTVEGDDFLVSNPTNGSKREVERDFEFTSIYNFGEPVEHEYFSFTLHKPEYQVSKADFESEDLQFVVHDIETVTKNYLSKVEVNNIDIQASIFKIVTTGTLVDKETDFLKKLTENYVTNNLVSRNKIASGKESFIQDQLRVISDSLTKVEMNLELFRKDKKAVDLSTTATNALDQTQEMQVERAKIQLDIKYYNSLINDIENNRDSEDFVVPSATGIDDKLINENMMELQRLYSERSKKKFFVTSDNQEMRILNKQVREATDLLLDNLRNAVKSARFDQQRVSSQLANFDDEINSLPTRENELMNIQRKSTLYENLFNYLSQELAKTGIARAESTSDTRVLDEARMAGDGPVAPQKGLLMVLAVTLGTLFPMGWLVFFSRDDAIENIDQIMANTNLPIIASIVQHDMKPEVATAGKAEPQSGKKMVDRVDGQDWNKVEPSQVETSYAGHQDAAGRTNGHEHETFERPDTESQSDLFQKAKAYLHDMGSQLKHYGILPNGTHATNEESEISLWRLKESFRFLSTNLKMVNPSNKGVIGITSIMPEEGKTFTSINLGITLAEAGHKTLIVDTDLRKPGLVDKTGKVKGKGLLDYLRGDISDVSNVIHSHDQLPQLDFIPTSVVEGNVHKLLSSSRMKSMVSKLRQDYDYILLDTPAAGLVSDFLLFEELIDINLFVMRRNIARIQFIRDIEKLIPNGKKKRSYIVFNGVPGGNHKYGYEEKYGRNQEDQLVKESLSV